MPALCLAQGTQSHFGARQRQYEGRRVGPVGSGFHSRGTMRRLSLVSSCAAAVVAAALAADPSTAKEPPAVPPARDGVDVSTDVSYGPDQRNRLDVFHGNGRRPMPILVFIPGGGFV